MSKYTNSYETVGNNINKNANCKLIFVKHLQIFVNSILRVDMELISFRLRHYEALRIILNIDFPTTALIP